MAQQIEQSRSASTPHNWFVLLIYAGVFAAGFWVIDHTPFASSYFEENSILAETENRTADRIEKVNTITAPVRICLGLLGGLFLLLPSRIKLNWGGVLVVLLCGYLFYLGSSAIWSENPQVSAQKFLVLCFFSLAAFGLARQLSIQEMAIVFSIICMFYIGIGVVAEIFLGNFEPHTKHYRFVGTCHPNSLAVYGSFGCLVSIVYFNQQPGMNRWLVLIFAVGIVTLIMTKSRTTLAGFAIAAMLTWFITFKPNTRIFAISMTLLAFVAVCLFLTLARGNVRAAAAEKLAMGRTKNVHTLTGRLPLWELLGESIEEKPLMGYGYLAYWDKERIEFLSDQLKWEIPHGHNMYMDVLLDGGYVGLTIFSSIYLLAWLFSGHQAIRFGDRDMALVFGFTSFAMVHGFAESLFKLPTFLLFILICLILRMSFEPSRMKINELSDAMSLEAI